MNICIVIPTYNESENIKKLVPQLDDVFKSVPNHNFKVLIVDGNSPDGTSHVVTDLTQKYPFLNLLVETKKAGLGAAYTNGFKYALKNLSPDVLIEMDADFQHPPKEIVSMVTQIDSGYDYVIGSRFTSGGSIPNDWAFYRKFLSIGGNLFTKIVFGIFNINDFTSGFKASRVKGFVDKIDLDEILSTGFAYKMDLLYRMHKLGAKFKEIPISFGMRDRGDSKMEKDNFIDSLRVVVLLRIGAKNKSFVKFLGVGFTGLFVDFSLFNLLRVLLKISSGSAVISGFFAMLTTFLLNNAWSFRENKINGIVERVKSFVVYGSLSLVPIVVRSQLIHYANDHFGDTFLISNAAFAVGILFGLVWNFTVYSKIIWRKKYE